MTPAEREEIFDILADLQRRMENVERYLGYGQEGVAKLAAKIVTRPKKR